jgi:hypothetical protein
MPTAEAIIQTPYPDRYLARLGKHATKMGRRPGHRPRAHGTGEAPPEILHAEWSGSQGTVLLNWGQWTMQATPGTLRLRADAADEANLQRIQGMLTTRLETFGRREKLTITWQPAGTSAA